MTLFYYGVLCILHILLLPILCILSCWQKYRESIPRRFLIPKIHKNECYDIWLHACSVGEVQSLQTLIESIPQTQTLFLSVITQTGYAQAKKLYTKPNITIEYLPFETLLPFCAPTCSKLFVFEAELWLILFVWAKRCGATTKLINARISTRSAHRYQKFRAFYGHLFSYVDSTLSQSDEDTKRLQLLGAKHVETLGNIKILNPITPKIHYKKPQNTFVIVGASTHAGEEEFILEAWQKAKGIHTHSFQSEQYRHNLNSVSNADSSSSIDSSRGTDQLCNTTPLNPIANPQIHDSYTQEEEQEKCNKLGKNKKAQLVIVPRHPERFQSVAMLCAQYGTTQRLSEIGQDSLNQDSLNLDEVSAEILLVDTMGALIDFYAISDVVVLGGAFAKIGGHNPLEPASFQNVLISGCEIFNQRALFHSVQNYYLVKTREELSALLACCHQLHKASINTHFHSNMIERILA